MKENPKAPRAEAPTPASAEVSWVQFPCARRDKARWVKAAQRCRQPLVEWITEKLNAHAGQ